MGCSQHASNSPKNTPPGATDGTEPKGAGPRNIVVYSPHGQWLEGDVKRRFEAANPGWTVDFLDLPGGTILERVQREKERPRADVWWGGSVLDFRKAEDLELLDAYRPELSRVLPQGAFSLGAKWNATFRTPAVIMFNSEKVKKEELPTEWTGLLDAKWKGKILVRDVRPSTTMRTIFCSIIAQENRKAGNDSAGFDWLKKLDANTGSYAGTPQIMYDQLKGPGPLSATLWNLADALLLKSQGYPFDYVIPAGAPVPVEPIALIKGAPNPEGAKKLYDFINDPEQLILMANERFRLPARTDLPTEKLPAWMREMNLKPGDVDWAVIDKNMDEWIARWDAEIKGKNK